MDVTDKAKIPNDVLERIIEENKFSIRRLSDEDIAAMFGHGSSAPRNLDHPRYAGE